MSVTEHDVIEVLRPVEDPELHRSIVDLGMVRGVAIDGAVVAVRIALTVAGCPLRNEIQTRVSDAVVALDGIDRVELDFTVMTDEERAAVREMLIGDPASTAGSNPTHGHSEGRTIPFADPMSRTRVLLIASGKGGVGKSSVSANLAIALAQRGKKVAIVDADVWGFSIPRMLGVEHTPVVIDDMLVPPQTHGVSCISMGFFVEEDQPVMWRGPMLHKALEQFLTDVFWDEPDYLVVDLPPGTGDVALSISGYLPRSEMYVVTTPQEAAQKVAQRAAYMAKKVQIDVKGIIENMSWFTGDDGKRYQVFGEGGGARLAEELEVPLIGQIPISISLRSGSDTGDPIMAADPDSEAAAAIRAMAERIDVEFAPTRRPNRGLKLLG
jgi:ATP-binding protein involved in chromosome partitioning